MLPKPSALCVRLSHYNVRLVMSCLKTKMEEQFIVKTRISQSVSKIISQQKIYINLSIQKETIYTKNRGKDLHSFTAGTMTLYLTLFLGYKITCWFNGKENTRILTQGTKFLFPLFKIPPSFANINFRECNGNGLLRCFVWKLNFLLKIVTGGNFIGSITSRCL